MQPHLVLAVACLGAIVSGSALAADAGGYFTVKGAGATSCRAYSEAVRERGQAFVSFGGWIEGYLSAMNRYEEGVYDIAGWRGTEALMASIARFCAENPSVGFHDVMVRLTEQLRATALTEQSEPVEVSGADRSVTVPAEVVRRVQQRLYARGHGRGGRALVVCHPGGPAGVSGGQGPAGARPAGPADPGAAAALSATFSIGARSYVTEALSP